MKTYLRLFSVAANVLLMTVAAVFIVLEGTLLFTGDFLLYESPLLACIQRCIRFLLPSLAFVLGCCALRRREYSFLRESLCLLAASLLTAPLIGNYIGILLAGTAALFSLSCLFQQKNKA